MREHCSWRRGTILLQTLVMCMVLAFISISVTRWVLNRYMGATRTSRSSVARGTSLGGAMLLFSNWNTTSNPSNSSPIIINDPSGNKKLYYTRGGAAAGAPQQVVLTYDEEQ